MRAMKNNKSKHAQEAMILALNDKDPPTFSKILDLIVQFPKLPKPLEILALANMQYSEEKGFEPPMFPIEQIDSAFYWTGSTAMPISLIRINQSGCRDEFLTIEKNQEATFYLDDNRDSHEIHKEGKSLVITHSDTDYGHEDFLTWLTTKLRVLVAPYGDAYQGFTK